MKNGNSKNTTKNNDTYKKKFSQKGRFFSTKNENRSFKNGKNDNKNSDKKTSFKSNNYGFPRIDNEMREEKIPSLTVPVDDHPRAMVLPFDQKAVSEVKPRKYTSGFEIFKIPMALARWLVADDYLNKLSSATGVTFSDKSFIKIEGDKLALLKAYSDSRLNDENLEKAIRPFYRYLSYFARYALENKTAVVFDL